MAERLDRRVFREGEGRMSVRYYSTCTKRYGVNFCIHIKRSSIKESLFPKVGYTVL